MTNPYRFLATSDHPIARAARSVRRAVQDFAVPAPKPVVLPLRLAFEAAREAYYFGARVFVSEPLLKSYAKEYGSNVHSGTWIHWIRGNGDLILGDNVTLDGRVVIVFASRFSERPVLHIGDGTTISHECRFTVGKSVRVGKDCRIAARVFMFDSNGHPADPETRLAGAPPPEEEVRPIVIEDNVWIGTGAMIFPGVTVGEGSVVSAGAAVISDVPPYTVVAGNPARVVRSLRDQPPSPNLSGQGARVVSISSATSPAPARSNAPSAVPLAAAAFEARPSESAPNTQVTGGGLDVVISMILDLGKLSRIGPDDDIQDAGFTSINMMSLRNDLEDRFVIEFPNDQWVAVRTPRAIWVLIQQLGSAHGAALDAAALAAPVPADATPAPQAARTSTESAPLGRAPEVTPDLPIEPASLAPLVRVEVELKLQASEMAQEEIPKDIAFLDKRVGEIAFLDDGKSLSFLAPADRAEALGKQAIEIAYQKQRSLRGLARKIVYQSPRVATAEFRGTGMTEGIHGMGRGQIALEGNALRLYRYFDRTLAALGDPFAPTPMLTPTLIPTTTLSKCDYFRSFPHIVTFTSHLPEDRHRIDDFRKRHHDRDDLDDRALSDLVTPEACLSPAVCYHVYAANRDRVIAAEGLRYAVVGRCFRYESSKMTDLRRLWEFTMREIVFLGSRDGVLGLREQGNVLVSNYLADHDIAGEIRTASDPFFIAPDADAKTFFQLSSDTKWEISLLLPGNERLAAGSLNYHSDFFGRAFACDVEGAGPMHSVCVAFGLERWVYAFLTQHGDDPSRWPEIIRRAPELEGSGAARGASVSIPSHPAWRAGRSKPEPIPASIDLAQDIEIERTDAVTLSEQSATVLREAWVPPVLNYSDEYLEWQLRFPGAPVIGVTARSGDDVGGFAAITPRRLKFRGEASLAYLLSFVAVRPAFRGRGVASKLYDELLDALKGSGLPAVVYVDEHSPAAQRSLLGSAERVGMRVKHLGQYANHGFAPSHESERIPLIVRDATDHGEVLSLIDACKDERVLWAAPDDALLDYYERDPRGRKLLVVEEEGVAVGAASVTLCEIMNTLGEVDRVTSVDSIWIPDPTMPRVATLFRGAAMAFLGQACSPVVSAPNVSAIPADVLRAARVRPTGAVYQAFALHSGDHPFLEAELTNLEVV
ncbi:GNAT family N-acetyltransferase [Chondromyces crocatus]|uniref:N-acetyltransferase domain-containing protein n=1 Tax=Chondromyces crocatus TaxID=52 RepID=A0A0K1ERJ9_CHOCO|nr:GNAT family N-acetyltransferase [Chondromyces crocatus]AKT43238.1 uncharacterized protein CMC5_074690 [Chondromyces crocatus]